VISREEIPALEQLIAEMQIPGRLKIQTDEPTRAAKYGVKGSQAFVHHDVVEIKHDDDFGNEVIACSAEGDWCRGTPTALLVALKKHMGGGEIPKAGPSVYFAQRAMIQTRK